MIFMSKRLLIAFGSLLTLVSSTQADTLECDGNLISPGASQESVLSNCGEPTSRNGNQWIYQAQDQDSLPKIVTFGGGVVITISDGNYPGFQNTPFDNQP